MVSEEADAALQAEHAALREQVAVALRRIAELEAKKTPPPAFVKANQPERPVRARTKRAAEHNHARRREEPPRTVEPAITRCPVCGDALGGGQVGRTRQMMELAPPPPVEVVEYHIQRGWCGARAAHGARRGWTRARRC